MSRQEVIAAIVHMLRPFGPQGDPAQREKEEAEWGTRAAGDDALLTELLDLTCNPATTTERGRVSEEAFQGQLAHVLAVAGACAPAMVIDRVGALTQDRRARATAIEILGAIGDPGGLRWLAPLVERSDLAEDEVTWLASSLGDIGTQQGRVLLDRLAARTSREQTSVHREIQIARDAIARRTTP